MILTQVHSKSGGIAEAALGYLVPCRERLPWILWETVPAAPAVPALVDGQIGIMLPGS